MRKINVLINDWLPEICSGQIKSQIIIKENIDEIKKEYKFKFIFFTERNQYFIVANEYGENEKDYLGCVYSRRTPLAGEYWTRGGDLPDGPLNRETWENIKTAILQNEIIFLETINNKCSKNTCECKLGDD